MRLFQVFNLYLTSMDLFFSFIVPVYNRPNEIHELLESLSLQDYDKSFEVVVVEDGSSESSEDIRKSSKKIVHNVFKEDKFRSW